MKNWRCLLGRHDWTEWQWAGLNQWQSAGMTVSFVHADWRVEVEAVYEHTCRDCRAHEFLRVPAAPPMAEMVRREQSLKTDYQNRDKGRLPAFDGEGRELPRYEVRN